MADDILCKWALSTFWSRSDVSDSLLIYRSCAALKALKRHQLVSLSKKYGLKASGKVCVHEPNSICGLYVSLSQS